MAKPNRDDSMAKLVSLCKRRGYVFPSSEIYGGLNSCWDYGPLGVELKRNVKEAWWRAMVTSRKDIVGLDASILMHPQVWEASGHVAGFTDPLVDCKACKRRFRADHLEGDRCPECGGELTEIRRFNLMFRTFLGPVEDAASTVFLRPETAQGIFVNFANVQAASRLKPPFGIAQIGKSFRNEITPGNFVFRTREFEQMEMEFFVPPGSDEEWFAYWRDRRLQWYLDLGIRPEKLRIRPHEADELAHYARACVDIEYEFPFGWSELEGVANRTDYDLKRHAEVSGKDLSFFDEASKSRYVPYVVEPAAGADRATLAFLADAYDEEVLEKETRTVLRLHPRLAPVQAAVFPLVNKEGMPDVAARIEEELRERHGLRTFFDAKGAIGRRYRRQDEAGTAFCVTVDGETLENESVTVRMRDSMRQERVAVGNLASFLRVRAETLEPRPRAAAAEGS